MNILITGASGFIGSNLDVYLKRSGNALFFASRNSPIKYESITSELISELKIEAIVHLAGIAHDIKNKIDHSAYYEINTNLTKKIYDVFLQSPAQKFIFLSSIKAVADFNDELIIDESILPDPKSAYGKSKLYAEQYLASKDRLKEKQLYILRPCMVHGPGNKGNLNLVYNLVKRRIPWPLGKFSNVRSLCSIDNLCFVINECLTREDIPSGIYNVADDEPLSMNEIIQIAGRVNSRPIRIIFIPKKLIEMLARIGDFLPLPLNTDRLNKITKSFVVSNTKILAALGKSLPVNSRDGLMKTLHSFKISS